MGVIFCEKECEIKKKKIYCAHFDPNKKRKKKTIENLSSKISRKSQKKIDD